LTHPGKPVAGKTYKKFVSAMTEFTMEHKSLVKIAFICALTVISGAAYAQIKVTEARIGCLDIQKTGNLTTVVAKACNNKNSCSYKAPTPDEYKREGVQAATRSFCTQAMEITYQCGNGPSQFVSVQGDAWNNPPALLACAPPPPPPGSVREPITVTEARIGCLDIQKDGNLTGLVAAACDRRGDCSYKAPTPDQYAKAGVKAATRTMCTQGMEITYHCGQNDDQVVSVDGDAWNHPPAELICDGKTIATNHQYVTPVKEECTQPALNPPGYFIAPSDMLDWTPTQSKGDYTFLGFRPPQPATPAMYNSPSAPNPGAPVSVIGANEGRVRAELRAVAAKKDPVNSLCQAAKMFTRNQPASGGTPSDHDFGNAFADLSVTGKATFARFVQLHPNAATLSANSECTGASALSISTALDRAYKVANALREPHSSPDRQSLGWIAVSGEDDQPYRPVDVPTNAGKFPEFQILVNVPKFNIPVNTRYMIARQKNEPPFTRPSTPLVDGGGNLRVQADPQPALANDAEVILFIHGMDSRLEEADDLTTALHRIGGHNFTVISVDLPTSGYADNIDHQRISPISAVTCHFTPVVDFVEEFIVAFVDTLDGQLHGQLKPKIKAVVGGSLGGNMAMRLGRRPNAAWITRVVPWSPAAIWPSMIAQRNAVMAGCDTGWDMGKDQGVNQALKWGGLEERFLPQNETPELRRELFYGGFDWDGGDLVAIFSSNDHRPQASCWFSDEWQCKKSVILASRLDRHETYDANFRAWHWRLGGEQLAFSQQQFAPGTQEPLYLLDDKPMLLFTGVDDVCADLGKDTRDVATKMVKTPGCARYLEHTGHSLDNEHPNWVAREIADFVTPAK
jgi:pimeloyl-ACP methyl ester carboxylesterase